MKCPDQCECKILMRAYGFGPDFQIQCILYGKWQNPDYAIYAFHIYRWTVGTPERFTQLTINLTFTYQWVQRTIKYINYSGIIPFHNYEFYDSHKD